MAKRTPDNHSFVKYRNLQIPVAIYMENRSSTRISIGADKVHLRLSRYFERHDIREHMDWAQKWLHRQFDRKPELLDRFRLARLRHHDRLRVMGQVFVLHIHQLKNRHASQEIKGHLQGRDMYLSVHPDLPEDWVAKNLYRLVHKLLSQRFYEVFAIRLEELRRAHFPAYRVRKFELKYLSSKWGSCSTDGHIILSSKLMLCPPIVRDYVMIHELAHLAVADHSPRFWKTVGRAMPGYEKIEKWLDKEGLQADIKPVRTMHRQVDSPRSSMGLKEEAAAQMEWTKQSHRPIDSKEMEAIDPVEGRHTLPGTQLSLF